MMKSFCLTRRFLRIIAMTFIIAIAIQTVTVEAWESQKIALAPVIDRAGYKSAELNQQLDAKLKSVFKFSKYEKIIGPSGLKSLPDKNFLETWARTNGADGVVVLELTELRASMQLGGESGEDLESVDLLMNLVYYDGKTGQYAKIKASRSVTQSASIDSSSIAVSLQALDEILRKLAIPFPPQFPEQ